MEKWTNKYKIMEDLSVAQGRIVPASFHATYGDNSPPAAGITEETEEEYYKDCIGDGDFTSGPDIGLIQEMLKLVKDHTISTDDDTDKVIVISKLNPTSPVFVPNATQMPEKASNPKKKRERNAALISILKNVEAQKETADIFTEKETAKDELNVKKSTVKECPMFRRKKARKPEKLVSQPLFSNNVAQPSYVPSALAKDYYERYLENSKKQMIQEDLWTRLERDLKIIEERKREELVCASPSTSSLILCDETTLSSSSADCASALEKVCLPQQRHLLQSESDCAVCEVFKKNVYDIKGSL